MASSTWHGKQQPGKDFGFVKAFRPLANRLLGIRSAEISRADASEGTLRDMKGGQAQFFLYMLAKVLREVQVGSDGWVLLDSAEAQMALGCSPASLERYKRDLKKWGYLEQKASRSPLWRIVPTMVYRGILNRSGKRRLRSTQEQLEEARGELAQVKEEQKKTRRKPTEAPAEIWDVGDRRLPF